MKAENRTKREQAEEPNLKGEIPFNTLIDLAPIAISISRYGIGIYANLKFLQLFGLQSIDDYIGRPTHEFFAPQLQAEIKEFIRRGALGLPIPKEYETTGLRADGLQFPMQIIIDRVNLADGPANISFTKDISDRKHAAEALRESEQRYRSIFEGVQDAIFVESLDGQILDVNPCACELFGYTRQQFLTKRVADLVPSQDKIVPFNIYEPPTVPTLPVETVNVRANGEEFPVELTIRLQDYNGEQVYYVVLRDITESKQADEKLRASEEKYRALFVDMTEGFALHGIICDENGNPCDYRFLDINPAFERLTGLKRAEVVGRLLSEVLPNEDPVWVEKYGRVALTGEPSQFSNYSPVLKRHYEVFAYCPAPRQFAVLFLDITERKRAEVELSQSREQLRAFGQHLQVAREEERSSIAREIHDELGQQLTALKMDLAWLSGQILPEQAPLIQRTVAMSEMVDSTIQTVRRVASELRPGMLDDLGLSAALEWQAGEFQARTGIVCKLNLPMEVVEIDRDQATALFRIFQEALTNISRHSRATKVRVVLKMRPDCIDFAIRDNGIGILESQISNPRSLGLTGMRERVYAFGGTLQFKSAAGKGTAVYVAMPLVKKQVLKVP
jgi:PAS domain S-box-containing protein